LSAFAPRASSRSSHEDLCLSCGLCCNGAIFADVKLKARDNADLLRSLGLPVGFRKHSRPSCALKLCQPCAAFDGLACRIYDDRPEHCHNFECLQLKTLRTGAITKTQALSIIRAARKRLEKVRRLLDSLGDTDEALPIAVRFRRTSRRLQTLGMDKPTGQIYGQLTLAVHDLNFILSDSFYPG
jgi:Fe-S-cluster containining protein